MLAIDTLTNLASLGVIAQAEWPVMWQIQTLDRNVHRRQTSPSTSIGGALDQ